MINSFYQPIRLREAIKYYRKVLELCPEHEMAAWFLGETLVLRRHAFNEARAFSERFNLDSQTLLNTLVELSN